MKSVGLVGAPSLEGAPQPELNRPRSKSSVNVQGEGHSQRRFTVNFPTAVNLKHATSMLPSLSLPFFNEEKTPLPTNSIAALSHRENTPLHALRDTIAIKAPHLKRPGEADALADLTGPVVLMGGYRGSVLRDAKTNRRLWAPVKAALRLRTADLTLGLTDEDELQSTETVVPEKMLTVVGGFVQMGKNLKEKLVAMEKEGKITYKSFGYDWRRNLDLSSAELLQQCEAAFAATGQGTTCVAHSMGGLVALHALARAPNPRVFARILFVGTPFQGCPNALGPLRHGDPLGWNVEICSPKAVFSMRSLFYFLPPPTYTVFEREDGTPIKTDFFSLQDWSHFGFSPVALDLHKPASATREIALRDAETASFIDQDAISGLDEVARSLMDGAGALNLDETGDDGDGDGDGEAGTIPIAPTMSSASRPASTISPRIPQAELEKPIQPSDDQLIADYLSRTLDRVQRFRDDFIDLYDEKKASDYPALGVLASSTTPTVRGAQMASDEDVIAGDFSKLLYGHGDGIALHESAINLPGKWAQHVRVIESSSFGHVSLLSDLPAIRRALAKMQS